MDSKQFPEYYKVGDYVVRRYIDPCRHTIELEMMMARSMADELDRKKREMTEKMRKALEDTVFKKPLSATEHAMATYSGTASTSSTIGGYPPEWSWATVSDGSYMYDSRPAKAEKPKPLTFYQQLQKDVSDWLSGVCVRA